MTEVVLFLVIVALCTLIGYERYETRKEREKLLNMLMSRSAADLANLELASKVKEIDPNPPMNSDLINIADLTDDEFQKHVIDQEVA